jgi:DNA repair exonuclease SbcCD ATPase subunit
MADIDQSIPEVSADETGGEVESYFHEYTSDDGQVQRFKDANELNDFIKKGTLLNRDYTQKSQKREAEYRERMQKMEDDFKKREEEFGKTREKYDRYDQVLKTRPQIAQQLDRLVNTPASANEIVQRSQGYADEKYNELAEQLNEVNDWRREQELERQRDAAYEELAKRYPDFDKEAVSQAVAAIDGDDLPGLLEMVYKSSKYNPTELRQEIQEDMQAKEAARMMRSGGAPQPRSASTPKTIREGKEMAYRDMGLPT